MRDVRLFLLVALYGAVVGGIAFAGDVRSEGPPSDASTASVETDPYSHHRFSVVDSDFDFLMGCGERSWFDVEIRNDGDLAWDGDRKVRVAYGWRRVGGDDIRRGVRTDFSEVVEPRGYRPIVGSRGGARSPRASTFSSGTWSRNRSGGSPGETLRLRPGISSSSCPSNLSRSLFF